MRLLVALVSITAALSFGSQPLRAQEQPPNIVVIVSDDMGYADIGVHGGKDIPTPNIDALARSGIRFTNGYVTGPYCSPTRAGLLTGRYQQRFGHEFNPPFSEEFGLPVDQTTLADRLKAAGYRTALIGKWHLGIAEKFHPMKRGFDEFFGFLAGAHSYFDVYLGGADPLLDGRTPVAQVKYTTTEFAERAAAFIQRNRTNPFFLYLAFNAVHTPMHATDEHLARFTSIADPERRTYAAMLAAMDDGIGVVMDALSAAQLDEKTLVVFFNDNGGPTMQGTSINGARNAPLRGSKRQTFEGGIRVPFFIRWKGRLPENKTDARPITQLDVMPTALAAASVKVQPQWQLDGVDLLPYLTKNTTAQPHDTLYWRFGEQMAIRAGDWKLVRSGEGQLAAGTDGVGDLVDAQLYNLKDDIAESNNLAAAHPDKVRQLAESWRRWNAQLAKPLWRGGEGPAGKSIAVNGVNLNYVDWGTGTPVVFLHGSMSDQRIWTQQMRPVSAQFRVLVPTMRYFGSADWPDDGTNFSQRTQVNDAAGFIKQLNIGPVVLVAEGDGATTALALAREHPELVRGLFMHEPLVHSVVTDAADKKVVTEELKRLAAPEAAAKAGDVTGAARQLFEFLNDWPAGFDSLPRTWRAVYLDNARTVALSLDPQRRVDLTCAQLGEIKVPVTISRGERTRPLFRIVAETVSRCVAGSQVVVVEGARHAAPAEKPGVFNRVLLAFLAQYASPP